MSVDAETLLRLRRLVERIDRRSVPAAELAEVGEALGGAVTIDLDAAEQLGAPLVVLREAPGEDPCFAALSAREREVAALVAEGRRNADIASALYISVATVKDHVHAVLRKTGLSRRAQIAARWRA